MQQQKNKLESLKGPVSLKLNIITWKTIGRKIK